MLTISRVFTIHHSASGNGEYALLAFKKSQCKLFSQMRVQVYSLSGQTEWRRKVFVGGVGIDLSSKLSLTYLG